MTGDLQVEPTNVHVAAWEAELIWLEALIDHRFQRHFRQEDVTSARPEPPHQQPEHSALGTMIERHALTADERAILALALVPYLQPRALDVFSVKNPNIERRFTEFGGQSDASGGFLPTFETAAFLVTGTSLEGRLALERSVLDRGKLVQALLIERPVAETNFFTAPLRPTAEALARLCHNRPHRPDLSVEFPARRLTTGLNWDDLVLPRATRAALDEILAWVRFGPDLLADPHFGQRLRPGYPVLFTGPPGTGKTLTATLLGKQTGRDVFCVDLSLIVSKWIGETEKNLSGLFEKAESTGWILFFDEADALFGKRSGVNDAKDRYANQEVSYLLQRIEAFDGMVILASNLAANIDEAFARRFQAVVPFPLPGPEEREKLWNQTLPGPEKLDDGIDTKALARYELTGGSILNVLLSASLVALSSDGGKISQAGIERAIAREMWKEGRVGERAP